MVLTNRHGELFIDSKSAGKPRTPVPVRRNHPPPLTPAPVRFNRPTVQDAVPRTFISSFNVVPSQALLHIALLLPCEGDCPCLLQGQSLLVFCPHRFECQKETPTISRMLSLESAYGSEVSSGGRK